MTKQCATIAAPAVEILRHWDVSPARSTTRKCCENSAARARQNTTDGRLDGELLDRRMSEWSLNGGSVPVAKCETLDDKAVDVHFGASGFIPDALDHRISPARQTVDRVVLPVDSDDHSAGTFAAQVSFRHLQGRFAKNKNGNRPGYCTDHEQTNAANDQPHISAPRLGCQPRAEFLANLLKVETADGDKAA